MKMNYIRNKKGELGDEVEVMNEKSELGGSGI
jgi:hypothetical protein